jgi:Domain of unknown function (DUF6265)
MKKTILLTALGALLFISWSSNQINEFKKTNWLIGTWKNETSRGTLYETWTPINAVELQGKSYMIKDTDTLVFETIKLVAEKENLFYIPTVDNQNGQKPVRFTMTSLTDSMMVFENPKHDFPQVISYKRIAADSLVAEISAVKRGNVRKQTFPMVRIN